MKRILNLILLNLFFINQCDALTQYISHCVFMTPQNKSYIESYISIPYNSIQFKEKSSNNYYAEIELTMFYKNKADEIIAFEKNTYILENITDSMIAKNSMLELIRKELPNGDYNIETQLIDLQEADKHVYTSSQKLNIATKKDSTFFSDIELVDQVKTSKTTSQFSKGNVEILPYTINFFSTIQSKVKFYVELYNSNLESKDDDILVLYSINDYYTHKIKNNLGGKQRLKNAEVLPILGDIDINSLESGAYELHISAIDKSKKLLAEKKIIIYRKNDSLSTNDLLAVLSTQNFTKFISNSELRNIIASHEPISDDAENQKIGELLKTNDTSMMRIFIFNFWYRKDPVNTQEKYSDYIRKVNEVQYLFGNTSIPGYTTDRGKTYLKYGKPDQFITRTNPSGVKPYSIWLYNSIGNQFRVKFIFIEKYMKDEFPLQFSSLRSSTNDIDIKALAEAIKYENRGDIKDSNAEKHSMFLNNEDNEFWLDYNSMR